VRRNLLTNLHGWGVLSLILAPALPRVRRPVPPHFPHPGSSVQQPVPQYTPNPQGANVAEETTQSGLSDNAAGGLAYITIIPAIVFLIVAPYNRIPFVRFHSWQSIFLAIAWIAADVLVMIIGHLPVIALIDVVLWPLVALGFFILWIIVLIKAFNGEKFKIPFIGDLAEKQANS